MTKRWKLKTNSSNILLVLITLILVKAEWIKGESAELSNSVENDSAQVQMLIGNDEIADYYFNSTTGNSSGVLEGVQKCLENFQFVTCAKMLLLTRVNDVLNLLQDPNSNGKDFHSLHGIFTFEVKNNTDSVSGETSNYLDLDEEIDGKVRKIFQRRSLSFNLFPNTKIQIEPSPETSRENFLNFHYVIEKVSDDAPVGRKKNKGGMPMMMMIPPMIMLGLMPFTLASLKAMVMNAVMINMMALNGAIFMTIRNLVFGPRRGDNVKYVNYGYSKDRQTQSRRPVLIIHSPAAFVKQPPVHRKIQTKFVPKKHFSNDGTSYTFQYQNSHDIHQNQYQTIQTDYNGFDNENQHERKGNTIQNTNHYSRNSNYKKRQVPTH